MIDREVSPYDPNPGDFKASEQPRGIGSGQVVNNPGGFTTNDQNGGPSGNPFEGLDALSESRIEPVDNGDQRVVLDAVTLSDSDSVISDFNKN